MASFRHFNKPETAVAAYFVVAMPSDAKWVRMAKKVAAGTALDDEVCSFKLTFAVLEKLPLDFVATIYENAAKSYRAISETCKTETRQRLKNIYVAEKRKVLFALATYLERKEVPAAVAEGLMLQPPASASVRVNVGGHHSARGRKRRKVNASDVDLNDSDIDTFRAQIVAILKNCWMWLP